MKIRRILLALAGIFLLMQVFRPDRSTPPLDPAQDFATVANPPAEVLSILRASCYDCHSYTTQYPWYAEIAPVSWWLQHHVSEGREHLNFSTFGELSDRDQLHAFKESVEMLQEGEMPLPSYTWLHGEARLTEAQRAQLIAWFEGYNAVGAHENAESDDD